MNHPSRPEIGWSGSFGEEVVHSSTFGKGYDLDSLTCANVILAASLGSSNFLKAPDWSHFSCQGLKDDSHLDTNYCTRSGYRLYPGIRHVFRGSIVPHRENSDLGRVFVARRTCLYTTWIAARDAGMMTVRYSSVLNQYYNAQPRYMISMPTVE